VSSCVWLQAVGVVEPFATWSQIGSKKIGSGKQTVRRVRVRVRRHKFQGEADAK
jgi:hypothetical protein